jgi:hypothetical protein
MCWRTPIRRIGCFIRSLQCYPRNEPPIEMDAMIVMDDRVLLLEIKDWNGTLTHNGDQWLVNGRGRGRSAVDAVSMKAKEVKTFLKNSIPGFSKVYVDSRVVLTGSATKHGLSATEQNHVWTLQEAASIVNPANRAALLQQTTFLLKKVYTFETDFERVTRNAKMFAFIKPSTAKGILSSVEFWACSPVWMFDSLWKPCQRRRSRPRPKLGRPLSWPPRHQLLVPRRPQLSPVLGPFLFAAKRKRPPTEAALLLQSLRQNRC